MNDVITIENESLVERVGIGLPGAVEVETHGGSSGECTRRRNG